MVGFEGIDDGFSDAQFGVSLDTGNFANALFATFSPAFWADVEDTQSDNDPATGMRIKVYALNARNGKSQWRLPGGRDYVEIHSGAALRHVSVTNGLLFVTSSAGRLFVLDARKGEILFTDQTSDLNERFDLGLGKPHHAGMNSGTLISKGMVYGPYGNQNHLITIYEAITLHAVEAREIRDAYMTLTRDERLDVVKFVKTLRMPNEPGAIMLE